MCTTIILLKTKLILGQIVKFLWFTVVVCLTEAQLVITKSFKIVYIVFLIFILNINLVDISYNIYLIYLI